MIEITNLPVKRGNVPLRVARGHFATNHSHINYYIDITYPKTRLSEAQAVAKQLVKTLKNNTPIDSILCLDGTAVIGTCLAEELTKSGFQSINTHKTVYVVEPEFGVNNQMLFRDNIQPMIRNKHVLILMASCTTGYTAKKGIETIAYYGGDVVGVAALYSMVGEVCGQPVNSVYNLNDLPDYASYDYKDCPYCKQGRRLDALVNSHGYSWL
ncbi:MAG: orotate phosphoribosyltransferase [Oscillospiraceae bacterium]|nr:orotate phosphoribosyltransferase [Oscillospiraceae bacterium]